MRNKDPDHEGHHHVDMEAAKRLHQFMAEQPEETMVSYAAALLKEIRRADHLAEELAACQHELAVTTTENAHLKEILRIVKDDIDE